MTKAIPPGTPNLQVTSDSKEGQYGEQIPQKGSDEEGAEEGTDRGGKKREKKQTMIKR